MSALTKWDGRVAELAPLAMAVAGTHVVQLYDHDEFLIRAVTRVAADGLAAGDAVVLIATDGHVGAVMDALAALDIDVRAARDGERLIAVDAEATLAAFMEDDMPDPARFASTVGALLERGAQTTLAGRVRAFGEMVAMLWSEGRRDAALAVESLWNEALHARRNFSLLCAYPLAVFGGPDDTPRFGVMCERHTHVAPAESYGTLDSAGERLRAIAELQQKALVLERELARTTARLAVVCKRCRQTVLTTSRIGNGEAEAIVAHLRRSHVGVLGDAAPTLGAILREVLVEDLKH
jgi:hypothetical protein